MGEGACYHLAMVRSRREVLLAAAGAVTAARAAAGEIPLVPFGDHRVSRLIVGGNPISGTSHVSPELSREMVDYFTGANARRLLRNCQAAGINTWQSRGDRHILRLLNEYRLEGGGIQWIGQTASELADTERNIREMAKAGAIGIYHHGSKTDRAWQTGKIEEVREALKVMRDAGVRVGLGTHIPEVLDHAEEKGWDVDFYMTCLYNLSRTEEEASRLAGLGARASSPATSEPAVVSGMPAGTPALPSGELFWDPDRERMLERVRRTSKQCLIFKVYGASRHCGSRERMRAALRLAFDFAKPHDCVVIGMFPKYKEQVRENCELVVEAARSKAS